MLLYLPVKILRLLSTIAGSQYLPSIVTLSDKRDDVKRRVGVSVVRDGQNQDIINKMVNLLPVKLHSSIANVSASSIIKTVLQGNPADKTAKPVETVLPVSGLLTVELAPYSFTIIRIKT
jgi:hypothetical protein